MAAMMTAKVLARLILKLSPIIIDATQIARKWMKKGDLPMEDIHSRLKRLERKMELQVNMNEQFINEMQVLKPVIDGFYSSIRLIFYLALLACLLSFVVLVVLFFK